MTFRSSELVTIDRRTFLRLCGLTGITFTLGSFPGCSTAPSAPQIQDVHDISFSRPATSTHIKAIIKAKGFDTKHGLNLIEEFRGTLDAYYNDVAANNVPMNDSGASHIWANMRNKGVPVKITQSTGRIGHFIVTHADRNDINGLKDIKGKRLAITKASFVYGWLFYSAKKAGFDLNQDVTVVNADIPTTPPMLLRQEVDVAWIFDINVLNLDQQQPGKLKTVFAIDEEFAKAIGVPTILNVSGVREEFLKANPGIIERFLLMYRDAITWMNGNLDEAVGILAKKIEEGGVGVPAPVLTKLYQQKLSWFQAETATKLKDNLFKEMAALVEVGFLDKLPGEDIIYDGLKKYD